MNYYIVECSNPGEKLRHYKNTRVANYTLAVLNETAGFEKYMITSDDDIVYTIASRRTSYNVDPFATVDMYN